MRAAAAAGAMLALLVLTGGAALAAEAPDAGADANAELGADSGTTDHAAPDGGPLARVDGGSTETGATPDAAPPGVPVPAAPASKPAWPPPAPRVDPAEAAAASARRAEAAWPLAYVDRPQTQLQNMESIALFGHSYRGPPGYRRSLFGIGYAKGLTDQIELALAFPRLYCEGANTGACVSTLTPDLTLRVAAVATPTVRLAVGFTTTDFVYSAMVWARLKLVVPHVFSFEIEPNLYVGVQANPTYAWWNPAVVQDGNQSRLGVTFDANVQITPRLLVWADGVPYIAVSELESPGQTAVEASAGVDFSFTKSIALSAWCASADVLPTRPWEYVPDFRGCSLSLVVRRFGPRLVPGPFHLGPIPDDFY